MNKELEALRFHTKNLHNTVESLKTSCLKYHTDTRARIAEMSSRKSSS